MIGSKSTRRGTKKAEAISKCEICGKELCVISLGTGWISSDMFFGKCESCGWWTMW